MTILRRAVALQDADTLTYLRSIHIFARLPDATLVRLVARCPIQYVGAYQELFRQGDRGDDLYVILSGEIEVVQMLDGVSIRLSTLQAGEYFGEMALIDDAPRSATARTLRDCVLLQVRKHDFLDLLRDYPFLYNDAARVLSARLREMNTQRLADLQREKQDLERSNQRLRASYQATLEALSVALDLRDQTTRGHSLRVTEYTLLIADALRVPSEQRESMRHGALLHDIGKIGVSDAILRKTTTLSTSEWVEMRRHPEWGAAIIDGVEFLRDARDIVLSHHEKFDGTGYPRGLVGTSIPLGARIFAVADVFDAVTTFRPYRMPMSANDAAALIRREAGKHFDPEIVKAFDQAFPQMIEVMCASLAR